MTAQIADGLAEQLRPRGTAVRVRAAHLCMTARGARAAGSVMVTEAVRGLLADDERHRADWARGIAAEAA
jgi:GTP cyclohydrolase I